jgi:methyltransferase family protein
MRLLHHYLADNAYDKSLATRLRRRRFQLLLSRLSDIPRPVTILDIGGSEGYWERMGIDASRSDLHVTLVNLEPQSTSLPTFTCITADGRHLPQFPDKSFDVVFSNSTIEHVGTIEDQRRMAAEVRRIGKRYFVQTPNRNFPIEPHFLFPCFQFLPVSSRVWLMRHFNLGWSARIRDYARALSEVTSIRLLTKREFQALFPEATIIEERFCGLVKSFVACSMHP